MTMVPVREVARGRWRSMLPAFGISPDLLTGKHVPCPLCGGKDRWRFDDKAGCGSWICSRCGAGDGMALVMAKTGMAFKDAALQVEALAGAAPRVETKPQQTEEQQRAAMVRLWKGSQRVEVGDPVDCWLRHRVGGIAVPSVLRTVLRCHYQGDVSTWHPAMIAKVTDRDDRSAMLHRTYLTSDGQKAPVDEVRKTMAGHIPPGSAVRLFPSAPVLGIAEGIETALAASKLFGVPVWSALNANILTKWRAPADTKEVLVFADHDASFAGQRAAYALAEQLTRDGILARVLVPDKIGTDWNDALMSGGFGADQGQVGRAA